MFRLLATIATLFVTAMTTQVMAQTEAQLSGEEPICFNGFVMDNFCIARGTLFDNNAVTTLEEPNRHTLHCLLDVSQCRDSGYELLMDPTEDGQLYGRVFRLDTFGNNEVLRVGRTVGDCSTCVSGGAQEAGFRATVVGRLLADDTSKPPLLQVDELRLDSLPCTDEEGGQFSPSNVTFSSGNGGGLSPVSVHGGCMITAWGFLLPLGVFSAILLRHRPNGLWFKMHYIFNITGLVLTIVGIIVAFLNFNVFADKIGTSYRHGVLGLTTFVMGILQVVAGLARPHAMEEGEEKSSTRRLWEFVHKGMGYITVVIAYGTMYLGADVAGLKRDAFRGVWYATLIFAGLIMTMFFVDKKYLYKPEEEEGKGEKVEEAQDDA